MLDRQDRSERGQVDSREATSEYAEATAPEIAAKLKAQGDEMAAMRRDPYHALRHQHCCCEECLESYRRWFG